MPPRHILVVEDNADSREVLCTALELEGHRVDSAADGVRGVELALEKRPEIVLIDIGLPGLNGYEVARQIRNAVGGGVALIALTGYGRAEDRRRAKEAGFDAHLVKPIDPDALAAAIASPRGQ